MSRQPSEYLFLLISRLTQAEKRYVKMELKRHIRKGGTQMEVLFDALAAMRTYDEASLKARFKNKGFARRLPEAKRELITVILRAMRQFQARSTPRRRALTLYTEATFLSERGLPELAERVMNEAWKYSTLTANHALRSMVMDGLVSISRMRDRYPVPTSDIEDDQSVVEARRLLQAARMEALSDRMNSLVQRYGRTTEMVPRAIARDLVQAGRDLAPLDSLAADIQWLRLQSQHAFFFEGDTELSLQLDTKRLTLIESNESYRRANLSIWITLVHSVALRRTVLGQFNEARLHRDTLRQFWEGEAKTFAQRNRRQVMGQYLNVELILAANTMDIDGIAPYLPLLRNLVADHESDDRTEIGIAAHFNIGLLEFGAQRYREALRELNRTDRYPAEMRTDIHRASAYLRILCHLELENDSVVTSIVRRQRRALKGATVPPDESLFLSLATSYLGAAPGAPRRSLVKKTLDALVDLVDGGGATTITSMFGFESWMRSKIERQPWHVLVRQIGR
jgi:hypothetical protein